MLVTQNPGETIAEMADREENWENIEAAADLLDMQVSIHDARMTTLTRMLLRIVLRQEELIKATNGLEIIG